MGSRFVTDTGEQFHLTNQHTETSRSSIDHNVIIIPSRKEVKSKSWLQQVQQCRRNHLIAQSNTTDIPSYRANTVFAILSSQKI